MHSWFVASADPDYFLRAAQSTGENELLDFVLDHLPSTARLDSERIEWDPGNLSLREVTAMPIEIP